MWRFLCRLFQLSSCKRTHCINSLTIFQLPLRGSFDSSVGRAEDCRVDVVILRSLVRIRLEGFFFSLPSEIPFFSFYYLWLMNRNVSRCLFFLTRHFFLTRLYIILNFWVITEKFNQQKVRFPLPRFTWITFGYSFWGNSITWLHLNPNFRVLLLVAVFFFSLCAQFFFIQLLRLDTFYACGICAENCFRARFCFVVSRAYLSINAM